MGRNLLTEAQVRRETKANQAKRLNDGDGLFLLLSVKGGSHAWRFAYRWNDKPQLLSLGTYPDTSLTLARTKADECRRLLAEGRNPSDVRKAAKAATRATQDEQERRRLALAPLGSFFTSHASTTR